MVSVPGGGTLPGVTLDSFGLNVQAQITGTLRGGSPPIVARAESGVTMLDLRTVDPADDAVLTERLAAAVA